MHVRKMHSCGNDFCLVQYEDGMDYSQLAKRICNRKIGIGADALIVTKLNPLEMIVFNPEGLRVLTNGNALRCCSRYASEYGLTRRNKLEIITGAGVYNTEVKTYNPFICEVNLGKPIYSNSLMFINDELDCFGRVISVDTHYVTIYSLFLGGIHTVVFVDSLEEQVVLLAEAISKNRIFARGTNVDFVQVVSRDKIKVKSYEIGNGFVLANGDGCAAGTVVAQKLGYVKTKVLAMLELGTLQIEITKKGTILLQGPAEEVFRTEF